MATDSSPGKHRPLIDPGEFRDINSRLLTEETCRKWGYSISEFAGSPCQVAAYKDKEGTTVAQKIRLPGKEFTWAGNAREVGLYGSHLWKGSGKILVITEGEIDALTVSQLQGNKWPVVSLPNGAPAAPRDLAKSLPYVEAFESVVLMFDNDDPGREAAAKCAALLTPGKAKIASLPLKDANEMLKAGRGAEVINAIWQAKEWRPDGIITAAEVIEAAKKPVEWGRSWPWKSLTDLTYGRRFRELYALGAGVGTGKTDLFTQLIAHDMLTYPEKVGVIYLEQAPVETIRRIAGKVAGKAFHVPDGSWTQKELDEALDKTRDRLLFYNHFGASDWTIIKTLIRFLALSEGVKSIYLDHLTALVSHADDERRALDSLMAEMAGLCMGLDISIFFVSHLATPEGKPHEEGGRVMAKHFRGSRSIMQWANFMFGLERNQQSEDELERRTATFRVLKDRNTGRANGHTISLLYDPETGMLNESAESSPFASGDTEGSEEGAKGKAAVPQRVDF